MRRTLRISISVRGWRREPRLGAHYVAQSTHNMATALSQGSLLLVLHERLIDPLYEQINELGLISTYFSYTILASIELGVTSTG